MRSRGEWDGRRGAAQTDSLDPFLDAYAPSQANAEVGGRSVLMGALANADPRERSAIATLLLADGADATTTHGDMNALHAVHALHTRLGSARLAPELEASLLRRLVNDGADVNVVAKGYGIP
ncbi:hypothetical protein OG345_00525 [Streptomyces sp. NBC_01220]|uniref:hypothetical protein n=1 Tax=Streptomyces sp. NBC_01220 TaxID=2903781 RepID=UPI00352F431F|nr:hypothetical protein OG345_00525 [Streptomyces sp. NBC_01220]